MSNIENNKLKLKQVLHVYINEKPIILGNEIKKPEFEGSETIEYQDDPKTLLGFIEAFEADEFEAEALFVFSSDYKKLLEDFFSFYKKIEAAGGLVVNSENKVLGIFRRGFWDLPKGKVEKWENHEESAVREVREETGIEGIEIVKFLTKTYHTYYDERKKRRVLKVSIWYEMRSTDKILIPQIEEDIEIATWMDLEELKNKKPIYKNILGVIKAYED